MEIDRMIERPTLDFKETHHEFIGFPCDPGQGHI